jgi:heavy metal translocating P-type ATPase
VSGAGEASLADAPAPESGTESIEPGLQADQRLVDRGWLKIGAGLAVAGQAMVFSLAVNISEIGGWAYAAVHGILILAAFACLLLLGGELVRSSVEALKERRVSIDLLFLVTLFGALFGSLISTFTRTGSVYYEVVAILIVVHTAGKMLAAKSRVAAVRAATATREKFESCRVLEPGGAVARRRVGELLGGERVLVSAGEAICVDGNIVKGRGYVQETAMTGEWQPVVREAGDRVLAGTYSVDGDFEVEVRPGPRKLDALLSEVERARLAPSKLQEHSDRLIRWFLPLVIAASVITFAGWYAVASWDRALFNAMAVLLVACPCAMGLATPVAVWGGLARLASMGLVARTGDFIDRLARATVVCLDKTGTLSRESVAIQEWQMEPAFEQAAADVREWVRSAESDLAHPIAQALAGGETSHQVGAVRISRELVPGRGIIATVRSAEGATREIRVGEFGIARDASFPSGEGAGKSVFVFVDGQLAARVVLREAWREGMQEAVRMLREIGARVEVLSGDPEARGALADVIDEQDCSVVPGLTPEQKKRRIEELCARGETVIFVGDGINDAAAMSAADASIAVKSATELARASSTAVMAGEDLRVIPEALRLSRNVVRNINVNLRFAAAYNLVGVAVAASGKLHPVAAALLMLGSSLFVSVRALRAR